MSVANSVCFRDRVFIFVSDIEDFGGGNPGSVRSGRLFLGFFFKEKRFGIFRVKRAGVREEVCECYSN